MKVTLCPVLYESILFLPLVYRVPLQAGPELGLYYSLFCYVTDHAKVDLQLNKKGILPLLAWCPPSKYRAIFPVEFEVRRRRFLAL